MIYELATLTFRPRGAEETVARVEAYTNDAGARGQLLGCWTTEHGDLFRLLVLRGFDSAEELDTERKSVLMSKNPFGAHDVLINLGMVSYEPFPFLPPVKPGQYGKVYEFRTYHLKVGGLPPTIEGWKAAMPERSKLSPLVIAMYALDGAPRFTQIWPYASLEARMAIRADSFARELWPPKGGPENIEHATSTIAVPTSSSPLA